MYTITEKNTPNQYDLWGDIEAIVLHTTLGAYAGAVEWLMMSPEERKRRTGVASYSSAHAVFGRVASEITQLAPFDKGTWHAGAVSNPSPRALAVLPKNTDGTLKNPNRYTLGLEFASGYDIDRDGILESWEKLYTPDQVKMCAWFILNKIEPATGKRFGGHNILTHKDITSYKTDLEVQRAMVVAELEKQRNAQTQPPAPVEPKNVIISIEEGGQTRRFTCQPI
jgi:N-acetylmuramoyl-L-alanine amidase CwlA